MRSIRPRYTLNWAGSQKSVLKRESAKQSGGIARIAIGALQTFNTNPSPPVFFFCYNGFIPKEEKRGVNFCRFSTPAERCTDHEERYHDTDRIRLRRPAPHREAGRGLYPGPSGADPGFAHRPSGKEGGGQSAHGAADAESPW